MFISPQNSPNNMKKKEEKIEEKKNEVILSLYFALATLRTKFYRTTLKN